MKRLFLIIILLGALANTTFAQWQKVDTAQHKGPFRGFALGADRDTLQYIVASPFDNWFIRFDGGLNTFIGNEEVAAARRNKLNYHLSAEIGKWMIPDIAVSLRYSLYTIDGQSYYGLQPFINYDSDKPTSNYIDKPDKRYYYYPFHATAMSLMLNVTLDWTNFFYGTEVGYRTPWHWFTSVGFGSSMLFGDLRNPRVAARNQEEIGTFRRNFELAFDVFTGAEYIFNEAITAHAQVGLFGSESTWDWSPYANSSRINIVDMIPTFSVGVKFNLIRYVSKYDIHNKESYDIEVYHRFQYIDYNNINDSIVRLIEKRDSLKSVADANAADQDLLNALNDELDRLQGRLADAKAEVEAAKNMAIGTRSANVLEDLLEFNELENLPAVVVYFELDKWDVDINARNRLRNFASEIQSSRYDSCDFYVIGAADSLTGSIPHNWDLSDNRASVVRDILIKRYGMKPEQLVLYPVGGITVWETKEYNRMTLVILKTPETKAIIDKWPRTDRKSRRR